MKILYFKCVLILEVYLKKITLFSTSASHFCWAPDVKDHCIGDLHHAFDLALLGYSERHVI